MEEVVDVVSDDQPGGRPVGRSSFPERQPRSRASDRLGAFAAALGAFSAAHARTVLVLSWLLAAGSVLLIARLTVDAGFTAVLPANTESVRHIHALERRVRVPATYMIGVEAANPELRAAAAADLLARAAR